MHNSESSTDAHAANTAMDESILHLDSKGIFTFNPGDGLPLNIKDSEDWEELQQFIESISKSLENLTKHQSGNDSDTTEGLMNVFIVAESNDKWSLAANLKPKFTQWLDKRQHAMFRPVQEAMAEMHSKLRGYQQHDLRKFGASVLYIAGYLELSCPHMCSLAPDPFSQPDQGYELKSRKALNSIELLTLFAGLIKIQQTASESI